MRLRPLFSYPGGLSRVVGKLEKYIPEHGTYIEPFAGGGSMFFLKPLAGYSVLNDKDSKLMEFYDAIRNGGLRKCSHGVSVTRDAHKRYKQCELTDPCCKFGLIKSSYQGNPKLGYMGDVQARKAGFLRNKHLFRVLPGYEKKLRKSHLVSDDFESVMSRFDGDDSFHFLDPPWDLEYAEKAYKFMVTPERVAGVASKMKGKVMVIYNANERTIKAFRDKGFYLYKVSMPVTSSPTTGLGMVRKYRLIAANWKIK